MELKNKILHSQKLVLKEQMYTQQQRYLLKLCADEKIVKIKIRYIIQYHLRKQKQHIHKTIYSVQEHIQIKDFSPQIQ